MATRLPLRSPRVIMLRRVLSKMVTGATQLRSRPQHSRRGFMALPRRSRYGPMFTFLPLRTMTPAGAAVTRIEWVR